MRNVPELGDNVVKGIPRKGNLIFAVNWVYWYIIEKFETHRTPMLHLSKYSENFWKIKTSLSKNSSRTVYVCEIGWENMRLYVYVHVLCMSVCSSSGVCLCFYVIDSVCDWPLSIKIQCTSTLLVFDLIPIGTSVYSLEIHKQFMWVQYCRDFLMVQRYVFT